MLPNLQQNRRLQGVLMGLPAEKLRTPLLSVHRAATRFDPTRTIFLRAAWCRDFRVRFAKLKQVIKKAIVDEDVFGLTPAIQRIVVMETALTTPGHQAFAFPRSSEKVEKFMVWLKTQEEAGLLQIGTGYQLGTSIEDAWTSKYILDSYSRGVQRARYELAHAGYGVPSMEATGGVLASMSLPFHVDRCFISGLVKVFTSKGWTHIKDVEVGDLVLTHKGHFKKVMELIRTPKQTPDVVKLETAHNGMGHKQKGIVTATLGHPVMVNGKWVSIEQVNIGDKISYLAARCKGCGAKIPYYKEVCGIPCREAVLKEQKSQKAKDHWHDREYREKTQARMKESFLDGTRDRFETAKRANDKTRELVKDGMPVGFQRLSQAAKDELQRLAYDAKRDSIAQGQYGFQNKDRRDFAISIGVPLIRKLIAEGLAPFQCPEVRKKAIENARKAVKALADKGEWGFQKPEIMRKIIAQSRTPESRKRRSDYMKANPPMKNPEVAARQSKRMCQLHYDHPERHPRRIVAQKGRMTGIERKIKGCLDNIGLNYVQEYPIKVELKDERNRVYFVDFAIPGLNLVIECDGSYWHNDSEKDRLRQERIEALGWSVIRYAESDINNNLGVIENELQRITCNHAGMYEFLDMEVTSVKSWKVKSPKMLYNLSVEDDESYVVNGFVVHNCGLLFTRTYSELKGVSAAMDQVISRVLSQSMADGDGARVIAKKLLSTISGVGDLSFTDKIGRFIPAEQRAAMLARTEIIRAYAESSLQEYKNWGVVGVDALVEFVNAGFNVCPECLSLTSEYADGIPIDEASGIIPVHPN